MRSIFVLPATPCGEGRATSPYHRAPFMEAPEGCARVFAPCCRPRGASWSWRLIVHLMHSPLAAACDSRLYTWVCASSFIHHQASTPRRAEALWSAQQNRISRRRGRQGGKERRNAAEYCIHNLNATLGLLWIRMVNDQSRVMRVDRDYCHGCFDLAAADCSSKCFGHVAVGNLAHFAAGSRNRAYLRKPSLRQESVLEHL
ncbi:hypothetical protein IE81DRAFT_80990 [Ceraceosorus guamensis]|uniref:Uncharacterized protein n=1 Tax=Ceraceosorus guamensis TaxID=1522189 RepID=A0A316WBJ2_9BASI|nr:hypothetical protein IE81DRAFT_80990 [Ceraceosorus guamensis]PWN46031.1 hypothetical protein IE81DRAFT_80990 [Ceraceosorus guamensis]